MIDPKPAARVVNPNLLRMIALEHDCCEVSGRVGRLHRHHILFRSHGGDDVRANILVIHDGLHEDYHRGDARARFLVGSHVRDHRLDFLLYLGDKLGPEAPLAWLTRHLASAGGRHENPLC